MNKSDADLIAMVAVDSLFSPAEVERQRSPRAERELTDSLQIEGLH